ncbi:MAG: lipid-A-disaccharide synthase N-terminal domain-containing protein [Bacteroidales bacterium]|nr:lipid-A-disaccharide synthase N-terminal domain-containing protein [Bacteroidales bacterium]
MYIYIIGFLAQALFSARILVQWILSEKAKRVVSPTIFWVLSMVASYLLFIYGWLRDDFAIMLGQVIAYYIYIWNLDEKGVWRRINLLLRILLIATPAVGLTYILNDWEQFVAQCLNNAQIPPFLVIYGSLGQIIFTLRFVYQFFYSKYHGESLLPAGFWIISLIGSIIIVSYGAIRLDPVLILGQSFGFISYTRNLIILHRQKRVN